MGGDDWSKRGGVQGAEEGSKDGALWDTSGELILNNMPFCRGTRIAACNYIIKHYSFHIVFFQALQAFTGKSSGAPEMFHRSGEKEKQKSATPSHYDDYL